MGQHSATSHCPYQPPMMTDWRPSWVMEQQHAETFLLRFSVSCGPISFQAIGFCDTDIEASESMAAMDVRAADAALAKARKEGNEATVERLEVSSERHQPLQLLACLPAQSTASPSEPNNSPIPSPWI